MKKKYSIKLNPRIVWRVDPTPTGMYFSFKLRGWPEAEYPDGRYAGQIVCPGVAYSPPAIKAGKKFELKVYLADYSNNTENNQTWIRRTLKNKFSSVGEAKKALEKILENNPELKPLEYRSK